MEFDHYLTSIAAEHKTAGGDQPHYGIFWVNDTGVHYKIFIGNKGRAMTFYSEVDLEDS